MIDRIEKTRKALKALAVIGAKAALVLDMVEKGKQNKHRLRRVFLDGFKAAKETFNREVMERE